MVFHLPDISVLLVFLLLGFYSVKVLSEDINDTDGTPVALRQGVVVKDIYIYIYIYET